MRIIRIVLYTGLLACANMASAGAVDPALLTGAMQKLIVVEPKALPVAALVNMADQPAALEAYKGKWLVLNLWATWCVPCREEMPALDKLAAGVPKLAVVAVASGPNPVPAIRSFLDKTGVKRVVVLRDPAQNLAHQMGVLGLPVTVIVNPEGQEVARLIGGTDWASAEAKAVFARLME